MPLECPELKEHLEPPDETAPKETLAWLAATEGPDLEVLPAALD